MLAPQISRKAIIIHTSLFVATFFTTTLAGVLWVNKNPFELLNFHYGLPYSLSILSILAAHEFGHYFAALYHRVNVTLPFFIPVPFLDINPFGTMGAVIRMKSPLQSKQSLFDIGIAGPLAGLVVTLLIFTYGLITLPGPEYIQSIHPDFVPNNPNPESGFAFGNSLFVWGVLSLVGQAHFVPPMTEIYHYPFLAAGWFGLFVTALNMIPVGQLDGGHILYAMVGSKIQTKIAWVFFVLLALFGLSGLVPFFGGDLQWGTLGWLFWAVILFFIIKLQHPPVDDLRPLSTNRLILGWITFFVFIFIFPPIPFYL